MIHFAAKIKAVGDVMLAAGKWLLGLDRPQLYRPEAHYMRGPGPKWRALYGDPKTLAMRARRNNGRQTY